MKDELDRQVIKEFVRLRAKTCSYLKGNSDKGKKAKDTKKCVIKKNYLEKKKIDGDSLKEDQK